MMTSEQINFLHSQEERSERAVSDKKEELIRDLELQRSLYGSRLTESEWEGLEEYLEKYEVDEETELHQVVEAYVEELGNRYDFLIYE